MAMPDLVVSGILNDSFLLFRNLGKRSLFEDFALRSGLMMGTQAIDRLEFGDVRFR